MRILFLKSVSLHFFLQATDLNMANSEFWHMSSWTVWHIRYYMCVKSARNLIFVELQWWNVKSESTCTSNYNIKNSTFSPCSVVMYSLWSSAEHRYIPKERQLTDRYEANPEYLSEISNTVHLKFMFQSLMFSCTCY